MQCRSGVEHGNDHPAIDHAGLAVDLADLEVRQELGHGEPPQGDDHPWVDGFDLLVKVSSASL